MFVVTRLSHLPHALGDSLDLEALCLCGEPHCGHQLLLLPLDLLLLNLYLLPSLDNLEKGKLQHFVEISHLIKNMNS